MHGSLLRKKKFKVKKNTGTTGFEPYKNVLAGHPLAKRLHKDLIPFTTEMLTKLGANAENSGICDPWELDSTVELFPPPLDNSMFAEAYIYSIEVNSHLVNLIFAIERLEDICVYISRFPQPRTFERQDITEDKWIHYHHSNFLVAAVGIFDTALLLVNSVLMLGIEPRWCKKGAVFKGKAVHDTLIEKALEELDTVVDPFRDHRHQYVHRNVMPKLKSIELFSLYSFLKRTGNPVLGDQDLDAVYDITRKKMVRELKQVVHEISERLMELFDSLQPAYESHASANK